MNYVALGVIGHVDHGKTALVKALAGVDTDRLKEEKARGISIVLGHANIALPGGAMGIVDVPGHERFIRTMIAGATGTGAVLLVVDVNEGVKPQTIEHLDIAALLGIREGIVAITKCDTADAELLPMVEEEIRDLVAGTFLAQAPFIATSSVSGQGIEELKAALAGVLERTAPQPDEGSVYMPVDRVFSMPGFGTVATGTLRRGALRVGDSVAMYPGGAVAKVRALQNHNQAVETSPPGHRTAVNLRGVEKSALRRGGILATPDTLSPGRFLGARLTMSRHAPAPLKHGQAVRLLFGTQETYPRVHLLDRKELRPGESCVLQFCHETEVYALTQEPFIVRTYSPMHTIGGGALLDLKAKRYRRNDAGALRRLEVLSGGAAQEIVLEVLRERGARLSKLSTLCGYARTSSRACEEMLAGLPVVRVGGGSAILAEAHEALCGRVVAFLARYHEANPARVALPETELGAAFPEKISGPLLEAILKALVARGDLARDKGMLRLAAFRSGDALKGKDRELAGELEALYREAGLAPPSMDEATRGEKDRKRIFGHLVEHGALVLARQHNQSRTLAFHTEAVAGAKARLHAAFGAGEAFSASDARKALDSTRKFVIPLLEYFDGIRFTRRDGDKRVIIGKK